MLLEREIDNFIQDIKEIKSNSIKRILQIKKLKGKTINFHCPDCLTLLQINNWDNLNYYCPYCRNKINFDFLYKEFLINEKAKENARKNIE